MKHNKGRTTNLMNVGMQSAAAADLMRRYCAYAVSIGCEVGEGALSGEICANERQVKLLHDWWELETKQ